MTGRKSELAGVIAACIAMFSVLFCFDRMTAEGSQPGWAIGMGLSVTLFVNFVILAARADR